jgi:uncharacterized protein YjcR
MHQQGMRTHAVIVRTAGFDALAEQRGVSIHTVRSWAQRDSIPDEHWKWLSDRGLATLEELAAHAERKKAA